MKNPTRSCMVSQKDVFSYRTKRSKIKNSPSPKIFLWKLGGFRAEGIRSLTDEADTLLFRGTFTMFCTGDRLE